MNPLRYWTPHCDHKYLKPVHWVFWLRSTKVFFSLWEWRICSPLCHHSITRTSLHNRELVTRFQSPFNLSWESRSIIQNSGMEMRSHQRSGGLHSVLVKDRRRSFWQIFSWKCGEIGLVGCFEDLSSWKLSSENVCFPLQEIHNSIDQDLASF